MENLKIIPMKLNAKKRFRKSLPFGCKVVSLGRKPCRTNVKTEYSETFIKTLKKIKELENKAFYEEI